MLSELYEWFLGERPFWHYILFFGVLGLMHFFVQLAFVVLLIGCIWNRCLLNSVHRKRIEALYTEHAFFLQRYRETGDRSAKIRAIRAINAASLELAVYWNDSSFERNLIDEGKV
jgi:hypothetical protein